MTVALVLAGAMIGAPVRYLADRAVQSRHNSMFPWGTFTVNVVGCLLLGGLAGGGAAAPVMTLLGTGFCGALTTYSTFSFETLRLAELRAWFTAVGYVALTVAAGLAAACAAYAAAHALC
ncbi:MAG: CrcB family protein [Mycobacteriaceae bacterium]|nr:CrcB family protein [Mycobacteriaceae bacterium]